jgi:hypothetical protein
MCKPIHIFRKMLQLQIALLFREQRIYLVANLSYLDESPIPHALLTFWRSPFALELRDETKYG